MDHDKTRMEAAQRWLKGQGLAPVDMADHVGIDTFDDMLVIVEAVVQASQSLSLDASEDRVALVRRLYVALGVVP